MPICMHCKRAFDVDDFMDDNITESNVCPECYYGGDMMEINDIDDYDDVFDDDDMEDEYDEEDSRTIRAALGEDTMGDLDDDDFSDELDDYEDRLDFEEGDYE